MFMYQVWKKSLDVPYIISVFCTLLMAILMQYYSFKLIQFQGKVVAQKAAYDTSGSAGDLATLDEYSDSYYTFFDTVMALNILTFGYLIHDFNEIIYSNLRGVFVTTFTLSLMIDITSFFTVLVWIIMHYGDFATGLGGVQDELKASVIIQKMKDDNGFNIKVTLAILLALQFTRLVLSLQVSRTFGPMVKILLSMGVDLIVFLFLFAAIFFVFAGAGQILFEELDGYSDMIEGMKTLFASSMGEFDYGTYDDLKAMDPYVGYVFVTVFIILVTIMLMNFLIAILSNTYELLNEVKNGLYLKNVINNRQKYDYDKHYSGIVFAPPPLNLIFMFVVPFLVYIKNKKMNQIVIVCEYLPWGILSVVGFTVISLVIMPFTYLLLLFGKLKKIPVKPFVSKSDFWLRCLDFIICIFIGLFIMFFWVILDIINFALNLFSHNIKQIDQYDEDEKERINRKMDGSLNKANDNEGEASTLTSFQQKSSGGKGLNPIKEGLSDTTLNVLKACLKNIRDEHNLKVLGLR
jgi:hypothetical protein